MTASGPAVIESLRRLMDARGSTIEVDASTELWDLFDDSLALVEGLLALDEEGISILVPESIDEIRTVGDLIVLAVPSGLPMPPGEVSRV